MQIWNEPTNRYACLVLGYVLKEKWINKLRTCNLQPSGVVIDKTIIWHVYFILALKVRIMIRYQIKEGSRLPEASLPAEHQSRFIGMCNGSLFRKRNYNGSQNELAAGGLTYWKFTSFDKNPSRRFLCPMLERVTLISCTEMQEKAKARLRESCLLASSGRRTQVHAT